MEKHNSKKAILFVHGILESPKFFKPFIQLVPEDWTVHTLTLKGHVGTVKDFSAASMAQWKSQVHRALKKLSAEHNKIIISAHSMGTLFAIQETVKAPVTALFLMNVPLKIQLKPILLRIVWSIYTDNIDPNDKPTLAAKESYGIDSDLNILHYIGWIPRYLELFHEISKTRRLVNKLNIPTRAYFSKEDEMVSIKSAAFLRENPRIKIKLLKTSWHHYYSPEDLRLMQKDLCDLLSKIK